MITFLIAVAGGFVGAVILNIVKFAILGRINARRSRLDAIQKRQAMAVSDQPLNHRDIEAKSNEIRARQAMGSANSSNGR